MKYIVTWTEQWQAEVEAESEKEAIDIARYNSMQLSPECMEQDEYKAEPKVKL